jgi:hypothetical protein
MNTLICWMNSNQGVAGWVQGVGSLLALAVVIGVAVWQAAQTRKFVREQSLADLKRRLEALLGLLDASNREIWRSRGLLLRRPVGMQSIDEARISELHSPYDGDLRVLEEILGAVPLHELPSWSLADAVLIMRRALGDTRGVATMLFKQIEGGHSAPNPLVPQIESAKRAIISARAEIEHLLGAALPPMATEFPNEIFRDAGR